MPLFISQADTTSISNGICAMGVYPLDHYSGRARLQHRTISRALVDGHNDLSLDGCEGDSGKGAKLGISLRAESKSALGEVVNDPVWFLLQYRFRRVARQKSKNLCSCSPACSDSCRRIFHHKAYSN